MTFTGLKDKGVYIGRLKINIRDTESLSVGAKTVQILFVNFVSITEAAVLLV